MKKRKIFEQPSVAADTVAELSKKLLKANEDLKQAETERKLMLENISHDLRAPLTAIRSAIDLMKQKSANKLSDITQEEMDSMLNLLDKRTKTLEVMVQDLYYLTSIEGGRNNYDFKDIPLAQFLEEYYFAAEIDEKFRNYDLTLDVPEDLPAIVSIDADKISRVLDNLFTNARKYSDEGSKITLGAFMGDEEVTFYVKDNGRGIPEKSLPYVFDRTYRVSSSRTPEKESSSGLGLAIAKSIILMHDGKIRCESTEGVGSCFFVELPVVG